MSGWILETAETQAALAEARALRHAVFVAEMGARATAEGDRFDGAARHLILRDGARPGRPVIGTLRLARGADCTAQEFDLRALQADPRPLAEIGRICLHRDYRGGLAGITLLARAVADLRAEGVGLLVGTGSFPGAATPETHLPALRALRDAALAPAALRPVARGAGALAVEGRGNPSDMAGVPALLKAYLRAGAWVGAGAWIDHAFNTVDVCLVLDMDRIRLPLALRGAMATP